MSSASASASAASAGDALSAALAAESAMYSAQHPNDARLAARGNVQDVDISDVTVALANGVELLSLARITLRQGCRYGLVGRNGCGSQFASLPAAARQLTVRKRPLTASFPLLLCV
jgi:ABC-type transport system involved in cytochrome bd biosynthesis fused ATPase/permease subunit